MKIFIPLIGRFLLLTALLFLVDTENNTFNVLVFFALLILSIISYYKYENRSKKIITNSSDGSIGSIEIFENKGESYEGGTKNKQSKFLQTFLFTILAFVIFYMLIVGLFSLLA
ncbi:MAG: hypothetical protein US63_C0003G0001 [Candidatus Moranbacteria bacterium GW2011_GWC2_37_8]|nr:MAG: hypothetical protein US63_C0003G0001 [Candidatus Moranbacteria bacterium GW2011_GWC2_37_8]KKQ63206.1 MAG: hypothetical protein US82_C0002G0001 [Parcubacteria group bacterium GW2011_GWC1_38_22]